MTMRKVESITGAKGTAVVHRDAQWDEYRVRLNGQPSSDYFTSDKGDAQTTARTMAGFFMGGAK